MTFGTFGHTKVRYKKSYIMYFRGRPMVSLLDKPINYTNSQNKRLLPYPLFLLTKQAQKKKL